MGDIYPELLCVDPDLPRTEDFAVGAVDGKVGNGVRTLKRFARGGRVAKFTGQLSNMILQHTLQISPTQHLHDPWFVGLLTHSCAPNCVLDMQGLVIWALVDIAPGELLTIDYAATEDVLHRQFACGCGASHCRKWITGRAEAPNEMGRAYLAGLDTRKVRRIPARLPRRGTR